MNLKQFKLKPWKMMVVSSITFCYNTLFGKKQIKK